MSMWQKKEEKQNGTKKEKTETKGKQVKHIYTYILLIYLFICGSI